MVDATTSPTPTTITVRVNVDQQCPIQYVTVYNDRAEVTRLFQHHFNTEGTYNIVLEGFSPCVDQKSLHVSGGTGKACTVLEVSYQTHYEDAQSLSESTLLDQLQSELDVIQRDIGTHKRELNRIEKQSTWLDGRASKLMNQEKSSNDNNLDMMQQFLDFYYKTLINLDNETTREEQAIKELNIRQEILMEKINEHDPAAIAKHRQERREVAITIHVALNNTDINLEISYLINNCSWKASYDVRVNSAEGPEQKTQLTYYGIIVNQSQENWPDAQFSLSTATPSLGGAPPKLLTLKVGNFEVSQIMRDNLRMILERGEKLDDLENRAETLSADASQFYAQSHQLSKKSRSFMSFRGRTSINPKNIVEMSKDDTEEVVNVLATLTDTSMSNASFVIPRRSTIAADGKPHKVTIGVLDLTSTFTYTIVPKLSLHAYLKASTTNMSDKYLLAGPASVFMDNNFITHSSIDNVCPGDTFDLPLGTDSSIRVDYKPAKRMRDTQGLISKIYHENVRYETHILNTKSSMVSVLVYDQVPLSSDEKIKVELILPDLRLKEQGSNCTVTMNDANNLEWKCVLQARDECHLPLEYTIEWPIDKSIQFK